MDIHIYRRANGFRYDSLYGIKAIEIDGDTVRLKDNNGNELMFLTSEFYFVCNS